MKVFIVCSCKAIRLKQKQFLHTDSALLPAFQSYGFLELDVIESNEKISQVLRWLSFETSPK